jgi:hypothetical protein
MQKELEQVASWLTNKKKIYYSLKRTRSPWFFQRLHRIYTTVSNWGSTHYSVPSLFAVVFHPVFQSISSSHILVLIGSW